MVDLRKAVNNQFMKHVSNKAKEAVGIDSTDNSNQAIGAQPVGPINWRIYNYPPLLRLIHYSTDELRQPFIGLAKRMHICALAIVVLQTINSNLNI